MAIKRVFSFFVLGLLFALAFVSAELKIEKQAIYDSVISEIGKEAEFNFKFTNLGESDSFSIYSLVGINFYPNESFSIAKGEEKTLTFNLKPEKAILDNHGTFNFVYKIKSSSGMQEDSIAIRIIKLKDALEINSYNIVLDGYKAIVYVKNLAGTEFSEVNAEFQSSFFNFNKKFSLLPYEKKEFSVELNKEEIKKLSAGEYTIVTDAQVDGVKERYENKFKFTEKANIITNEDHRGFLISKQTIEKRNEGNIPYVVQIKMNKNILSRLFTTFNFEPSEVERDGVIVRYAFQKEIKPSESFIVIARTNWFYPLIILAAIIIIAYLVYVLTSSYLIVKKKVSYVKTKSGEFALKVTLIVRARKFAEKIKVVDKLPYMFKLHDRFVIPPRIDEKNKRLEWDIDSLQENEERVFSYIIYSKIAPVGKFELPLANAIFEKDGKIHETESNRVFFISDVSKEEL